MSQDYDDMLAEFDLTEDAMLRLGQLTTDVIAFPHAADVAVGPSAIHGQGLFATQPFYAGETIAPAYLRGHLTPAGRYTNHASNPNAQYVMDEKFDLYQVALRDIALGEEITNDYRRNARVSYASVAHLPLTQVTLAMVIDALRIAAQKTRLGEVHFG
jgi:hypothetical protein